MVSYAFLMFMYTCGLFSGLLLAGLVLLSRKKPLNVVQTHPILKKASPKTVGKRKPRVLTDEMAYEREQKELGENRG